MVKLVQSAIIKFILRQLETTKEMNNMGASIMANCGCRMYAENGVFKIEQCSEDCQTFKYVIEKSKQRGNKIVNV